MGSVVLQEEILLEDIISRSNIDFSRLLNTSDNAGALAREQDDENYLKVDIPGYDGLGAYVNKHLAFKLLEDSSLVLWPVIFSRGATFNDILEVYEKKRPEIASNFNDHFMERLHYRLNDDGFEIGNDDVIVNIKSGRSLLRKVLFDAFDVQQDYKSKCDINPNLSFNDYLNIYADSIKPICDVRRAKLVIDSKDGKSSIYRTREIVTPKLAEYFSIGQNAKDAIHVKTDRALKRINAYQYINVYPKYNSPNNIRYDAEIKLVPRIIYNREQNPKDKMYHAKYEEKRIQDFVDKLKSMK